MRCVLYLALAIAVGSTVCCAPQAPPRTTAAPAREDAPPPTRAAVPAPGPSASQASQPQHPPGPLSTAAAQAIPDFYAIERADEELRDRVLRLGLGSPKATHVPPHWVVEYPVHPDWRRANGPAVNARVVLNDATAELVGLTLAERPPFLLRDDAGALTEASAIDVALRAVQNQASLLRIHADAAEEVPGHFWLVRLYESNRDPGDRYVARIIVDARSGEAVTIRGSYREAIPDAPGLIPVALAVLKACEAAAHLLPRTAELAPEVDRIADVSYRVRFPTNLPRGTLGAGTFASVSIDAKTGVVHEVAGPW